MARSTVFVFAHYLTADLTIQVIETAAIESNLNVIWGSSCYSSSKSRVGRPTTETCLRIHKTQRTINAIEAAVGLFFAWVLRSAEKTAITWITSEKCEKAKCIPTTSRNSDIDSTGEISDSKKTNSLGVAASNSSSDARIMSDRAFRHPSESSEEEVVVSSSFTVTFYRESKNESKAHSPITKR